MKYYSGWIYKIFLLVLYFKCNPYWVKHINSGRITYEHKLVTSPDNQPDKKVSSDTTRIKQNLCGWKKFTPKKPCGTRDFWAYDGTLIMIDTYTS